MIVVAVIEISALVAIFAGLAASPGPKRQVKGSGWAIVFLLAVLAGLVLAISRL